MTREELKKTIEIYQLLNNKFKEQEFLEKALDIFPNWEWAREQMKILSEYWRNNFVEYKGEVELLKHKKVCIFAHYDANKKIADYVVHWSKSLLDWDCGIIFISSCEALSQEEINKVKPYVSKIIVRPNHGYDFGSYCVGVYEAKKYDHMDYIVLINDSMFGPFYSLNRLHETLLDEGHDFFAILDAPFDHNQKLHGVSCFLIFKKYVFKSSVFNDFFQNMIFLNDRNRVIYDQEIELSKVLLQNNFKLKSLCSCRDITTHYSSAEFFYRTLISKMSCPFMKKAFNGRLIKGLVNRSDMTLEDYYFLSSHPKKFALLVSDLIQKTEYDIELINKYYN